MVMVSVSEAPIEPLAGLHPVKVGFIVPKSVGNSVVRHRLYRQLRHLMRDRLSAFGHGDLVTVRAFPAAEGSSSAELGSQLDRAIETVIPPETYLSSPNLRSLTKHPHISVRRCQESLVQS